MDKLSFKQIIDFVQRPDLSSSEQLTLLRSGTANWNSWRDRWPSVRPQLCLANLSGLKLQHINLSKAELDSANLKGSDLRFATFTEAVLSHANLDTADVRGANFCNAKLDYVSFNSTKLSAADSGETGFVVPNFHITNFTGASLKHAKLVNCNCKGVIMRGVDLTGASIWEVNFERADLSCCSLLDVNLENAQFLDTSLIDVRGLETIKHRGRCEISISTLGKLGSHIPRVFLQEIGVPDYLVRSLPATITVDPIQYYSFFISYCHEDEEFAKLLHAKMREIGLTVWFAPENLQAGKKLHEQVFGAIDRFDRILLVLSENSMTSKWVASEVRKAEQREVASGSRILFPVRLCNFDSIRRWELFDSDIGGDVAAEVRQYYIPDFSNWRDVKSFKQEFDKLVHSMRKLTDDL